MISSRLGNVEGYFQRSGIPGAFEDGYDFVLLRFQAQERTVKLIEKHPNHALEGLVWAWWG